MAALLIAGSFVVLPVVMQAVFKYFDNRGK
jgi:hypothetical protein